LGETLRACVRPSDGAFRLGGDEFALLIEGVVKEDALELWERLERAATDVLLPRGAWISFGASVLTAGTKMEAALKAADRSLYEAKRRHPAAVVTVGKPSPG